MGKYFWEEPDEFGGKYLFTYPFGLSMFSFSNPAELARFKHVYFHIVRCSLLSEEKIRETPKRIGRVPDTGAQLENEARAMAGRITDENRRGNANRAARRRPNYFHVPTRSGVVLRLAPFDFTEWSKKDMDDLQAQLKAQSPRKGGAAWFTDDVLGS